MTGVCRPPVRWHDRVRAAPSFGGDRGSVRFVARYVDAALLADAEDILREYSPDSFDDLASFAGPKCIAAVAAVEVTEAWRAAYPSLEEFYAAHEERHPSIRVYSTVREQLLSEDDALASAGVAIGARLRATSTHRRNAA